VTPATTIETYTIDLGLSQLTVRAFATGMFSSLGHSPALAVREFSGQASFYPEALDAVRLMIRIKASSLSVTDNISQQDRKELERTLNQDVLDTIRYPEIVFESIKAYASKAGETFFVNLMGALTLHGVTNSQAVAARVSLTGDLLRAHGEFSVLQSAHGIKPVSVAGGAIKLKDELKCSFDIVARKKEDDHQGWLALLESKLPR
jgi:polyisoprenoid-binding protein YceI